MIERMLLLYEEVLLSCFFFFFQAEDGIRDLYVTGVQTCALPISTSGIIVVGMGELELWKRIVQWGIGQLPATMIPDVARWPDEDCVGLEKVLRPLISYIRWSNMSPVDFERQVHSYKRILPTELYTGTKPKYVITKKY